MAEFKERLMTALKSAADAFNSGSSPDEAVVKAATDANFNREQTDRLVEMMNTAMTLNYFDKHASDRTGEFPLATKEGVTLLMYGGGKTEKTAGAKPRRVSGSDYSFYETAPRSRRPVDTAMSKVAAAAYGPRRGDGLSGLSIDALAGKAARYSRMCKQAAEALSDTARAVGGEMRSMLAKLAADLSSGYEEDAARRYAVLTRATEEGAAISDLLAETVPNRVVKAAESVRLPRVVDPSEVAGLVKAAGEIVDLGREADEMSKEAEEWREQGASVMDDYLSIFGVVPYEKDAEVSADNVDDVFERMSLRAVSGVKYAQAGNGHGGHGHGGNSGNGNNGNGNGNNGNGNNRGRGFWGDVDSAISKGYDRVVPDDIVPPPTSSEMQSVLKKVLGVEDSADAERRIQENLERSAMLEDFIAHDPIIREYDPDEVVRAYESLMRLAPKASRQPEVARSAVRTLLTSNALDAYSARMFVDLENAYNKTPTASPSAGGRMV